MFNFLEKGYDEFIEKILEFYSALTGDENTQNPQVFYKMFLEDLINALNVKLEFINICMEILLLLSYIANQNDQFKCLIEKSEPFLKILQTIIKTYEVIE